MNKNQIRNKDIEVIQDDGEYIICDFVIYKDKNPELFKRNGEINKSKFKKLQIVYPIKQ